MGKHSAATGKATIATATQGPPPPNPAREAREARWCSLLRPSIPGDGCVVTPAGRPAGSREVPRPPVVVTGDPAGPQTQHRLHRAPVEVVEVPTVAVPLPRRPYAPAGHRLSPVPPLPAPGDQPAPPIVEAELLRVRSGADLRLHRVSQSELHKIYVHALCGRRINAPTLTPEPTGEHCPSCTAVVGGPGS
jgi:hypothetical protein